MRTLLSLLTLWALLLSPCFAQLQMDRIATKGVTVTPPSPVFTNTQINEYFQSILNGCSPQTEWARGQGTTNHVTDGGAFCNLVPSSSTVFQSTAVAGYASSGGTATNVVASYGQYYATAATAHGWGGNFLCADGNFAGITCAGVEIDANIQNTATTGAALQVNGSFPGNPTSFPGIQIAAPLQGGKWSGGVAFSTGATSNALIINPIASGAGQASMFALWSGSAGTATTQANANGSFLIQPASGQGLGLNLSGAAPRAKQEIGSTAANPTALNTDQAAGALLQSDGGNIGLVSGVSTTGTTRGWIQARNNVGANNTAYPITLNELGGGVQIGGGSTINSDYKGTATLTYGAIGANACAEQPLTITGAASGDVCWVSPASDPGANFSYGGCRVSGANTAQVRICSGAGGTPSAVSWTGWARH